MTIVSSNGTNVPNNPLSAAIPPTVALGVVQHALITATLQARILEIVDETMGAPLGDIMAALGDHPNAAGAVTVLVNAGILVFDLVGALDVNTVVRRAEGDPDPSAPGGLAPASGGPRPMDGIHCTTSTGISEPRSNSPIPDGLISIEINPLVPTVVCGEDRRLFAQMSELRRPGVYILASDTQVYVGTGRDVAARVASGQQRIADVETIAVITDASGALTEDDARAAERILWSRLAAGDHRKLVTEVPDGADIDPLRYTQLDTFLAQACLALRHEGSLFLKGSARTILSGPRSEPTRVAPVRPLNEIPRGDIFELNFNGGLVALAARQSDDLWILLRGSDVRLGTAGSANCTTRFLRSAWAHGGLLDVSPDGRSFVATRDLVFSSCTGLSQFVTGAKGYTRACWSRIDSDGGYDPDIDALIAG